ncbi:MAG: heme-binding protein [Chloroflexi bacterium]|nr:MAG: heme-binding protein [Chloroflexota bacterium]
MDDTIEQRTLSLSGALRVLDTAVAAAERAGLQVSVAVLGRDGQLKAFASMDGASVLSTETARKKALTVLKVGRATHEFAAELKAAMAAEPELFHGMLAMDGIATFGGGVPINVGGQLVGAVAVSGASSEQDEAIAHKAATMLQGERSSGGGNDGD